MTVCPKCQTLFSGPRVGRQHACPVCDRAASIVAPKYLGQYPCALCPKLVRVYDWLPECVLCATCKCKVERQERKAEQGMR